jgi:hypothetical protein
MALTISYWPSRNVPKDALPYIHDVPPRLPANYDHDREEEGEDPVIIQIDGLDEDAIKKWWNNGKGHGDWGDLNNCSDIVGEALRQGGLPVRKPATYSTPEHVKGEVERRMPGFLHDKQYPPPVPKPAPEPCRTKCL